MNYQLEMYDLKINIAEDGKCSIILSPKESDKVRGLDVKNRKIYIVCNDKIVLYVGEAKTSMTERFKRGLSSFNHYKSTGIARGSYKGYKWLDTKNNAVRNLTLHVATFDSSYDDKRNEGRGNPR